MKYNYHTHTFRCNHADGTEREFVEEAIKGGIKVLGFSDHSPMPFTGEYYSTFRMRMDELDDYCHVLSELKKEYASDIEIHIGLEAEYYPLYFDKLLDFIKDYPIEYLLQGQHCLNNEYDGIGCGWPTKDTAIFRKYVEQTCEGMRTGKFLYLAHPDLINYEYLGSKTLAEECENKREVAERISKQNGLGGASEGLLDKAGYQAEMRKICITAKEMNLPIEINLLGLATNRNYPNRDFWEVAAEEGNQVIIGIDAHHVNMINMPEVEEKARKMVRELGLNLIESMNLGL